MAKLKCFIQDFRVARYGSGDNWREQVALFKDLQCDIAAEKDKGGIAWIHIPFSSFLQAKAKLAAGKQSAQDGIPSELFETIDSDILYRTHKSFEHRLNGVCGYVRQ